MSQQGPVYECRVIAWCERKAIAIRFGAIGKRGSIAVIERFIKTMKDECTRRLVLIPLDYRKARTELSLFQEWYNEYRPHMTLQGKTPDEVYDARAPRNRKLRIEPRPNWPRPSPCASPQVLIAGQPGNFFRMDVEYLVGRNHLPIVTLRRAA